MGIHDSEGLLSDPDFADQRGSILRNLGSCSLTSRAWRNACFPIQWRSLSLKLEAVRLTQHRTVMLV